MIYKPTVFLLRRAAGTRPVGCLVTVLVLLAGDSVAFAAASSHDRLASDPPETRRTQPSTTTHPAPAAAGHPAPMPEVSFEDLALLVQTSRRALRDQLLEKSERGPSYRPPDLRGLRARIHLTLRFEGRVLAEAESDERDVVDAAVAAGMLLGRTVLQDEALAGRREIRDGGDALGLEFEWIGQPDYLAARFEAGTLWANELIHGFEGGLEGIGVRYGNRVGRTRPGTVIARNYTPDLALLSAEGQAGVSTLEKQRHAADIRYFRFGVYHLWQPAYRAVPVRLTRGERLLGPEAVSADGLDRAIERMSAYLRYRQNSSGWFSHSFSPTRDRYLKTESATGQMLALGVLTRFARYSGKPDALTDALRGIRAAATHVMEVRRKEDLVGRPLPTSGPFAPTKDPIRLALHFNSNKQHLDVTARLLKMLSILDSWGGRGGAESDNYEAVARGLAENLIRCQASTGAFSFGPASGDEDDANARAAGRLVGALAEWAVRHPDPRIEAVLQKAFPYYRKKVELLDQGDARREASAMAAAALARGFSAAYRITNDARMSDFVFGLLDQFAALQLDAANCPWPELRGAINVRKRGAVGVDTAWYCCALADGAILAERVGDRQRVRRYRASVRAATRFILQLQFSEAGCYHVRSRADALGGVRTAPWDSTLRIDHCAESLLAVMKARRALFGTPAKK